MNKITKLGSFEEFRKKLNKPIDKSLNESNITIEIGEYVDFTTKKDEINTVNDFSYIPKVDPITVVSCNANIKDDTNTEVELVMSNKDIIQYDLKETFTKPSGQTVPPFYKFVFKINNKIITTDLNDVVKGNGNGTVISEILYYYEKNWLEKK